MFSTTRTVFQFQRNLMKNFKVPGYFKKMGTAHNIESMMYRNPCLDLQQYIDIKIIDDKNCAFDPSITSMQCAQELFRPSKFHKIELICREILPEKFPDHELPEVAFLGQTNAGKSSLLKAMVREVPELQKIIRTSQIAGRTKSLQFYNIGKHLCLVDVPGYGYREPKMFGSSLGPYLKNRRNLVKTFLLIDGTRSFQSWDDAAFQMLEDMKIPFAIVLTKIDAIPDSQRLKTFLHVHSVKDRLKMNTCFPQIFMLSTKSLEGMAYFMAFIAHVTGNQNPKTS